MEVLFDNTSFAGAIRFLKPEHEIISKSYYRKYADFKKIDKHSFCEFLTAICLFDKINLEASSKGISQLFTNLENKNIFNKLDDDSKFLQDSWVFQLKEFLPETIADILIPNMLYNPTGFKPKEENFIQFAFDIINSEIKEEILLKKGEEIPSTYYSKEYFYRSQFEVLNNKYNSILDDEELINAMFLHRGLFLQNSAANHNMMYMPHYYRGKVLSSISPIINTNQSEKKLKYLLTPSKIDKARIKNEYFKEISLFYYSLIQEFNWIDYNINFPFIGVAILEISQGNADKALELALYYRKQTKLGNLWSELFTAVEQRNKVKADSIFNDIKKQLERAAKSIGIKTENQNNNGTYKLLKSFGVDTNKIANLILLLPRSLREKGHLVLNQFIRNTPHQSMFVLHAKSGLKI